MAKSIRSKVKKRLRTVKRGVVKAELLNPTSKLGVREIQKGEKLREALSGYIKPGARPASVPDRPTPLDVLTHTVRLVPRSQGEEKRLSL